MTDARADYLSPALVSLLAIAKAELGRYVNYRSRGAVCLDDWPREPACLSAFMLGSL